MAVSAARSKILPRPSAVACCEAVLKTFSKTRGTARMKVGWNCLQVGEQVLDVGAVAEPGPGLHAADLDDPREHVRQRQEQQRRGVVGRRTARRARRTATPSSNMKLPWVSMQPLGRPVVPEV